MKQLLLTGIDSESGRYLASVFFAHCKEFTSVSGCVMLG